MKRVAGKRVLITGAAAGIGFCTAENFAKAKAELIITDLNAAALESSAEKLRDLGAVVHTRVLDVSNQQAVQDMAKWVIEDLGGLDILVNNAGIGHSAEVSETSIKTWKKLVDVNLFGPLYHMYAFLPHMMEKHSGHIVNISSGQAFIRLPLWGPYAAVKAALGTMSEVSYFELRKHGIMVTTIYPFMVNTGFYKEITEEAKTFGAKMSMKLVPYYSMSPQKVAKIIYKAILKEKRIEMVSVFNDLGLYANMFSPISVAFHWGSEKLQNMGKS